MGAVRQNEGTSNVCMCHPLRICLEELIVNLYATLTCTPQYTLSNSLVRPATLQYLMHTHMSMHTHQLAIPFKTLACPHSRPPSLPIRHGVMAPRLCSGNPRRTKAQGQ